MIFNCEIGYLRMSSPHVRGRIDQPGHVQCPNVSKYGTNKITVSDGFIPEIHRYEGRYHKTADNNQW